MIHKPQEKYMQLAIQEARKNIMSMDGGPFGACIVKDDKVISVARNNVLRSDATAHAEINAIRLASKQLQTYNLSGCVIYSTTEPCPMCFSAIHWSRIDMIIYGTSIQDVKKIGFNELCLSNSKMKMLGKAKMKIKSGFLLNECKILLEDWNNKDDKEIY